MSAALDMFDALDMFEMVSGTNTTIPASPVYQTSPVKRRRRTNAELRAIDEAIIYAVRDEHPVSLRGVYYRVVSAGTVEKTEKAYSLVGRQLLKLRRSGTIPYDWITDGTRLIRKSDSFDDVEDALWHTAESYRRALWRTQKAEVMVFTEKDAISGILFPVTDSWDVPLGVVRGYASETFAYSVAMEIVHAASRGKVVYVYQFGDHDPSGVDAWRNFEEKVANFEYDRVQDVTAVFERLAVTPEQIETLDLPTRPTKKTDTRSRDFDGDSVEVDAIPANILREIAEAAITKHIDAHALEIMRVTENSEREILERMAVSFAGDDGERP